MEDYTRGTYRDFEVHYKGNRILVRNEGEYGERLFVNGILQDQNVESGFCVLTGSLYSGNNITDRIEVRLKMNRVLECIISVNDEVIYSNVYSGEMTKKKVLEQENTVYASQRKINRRMLIFLGIISILIVLVNTFGPEGLLW